MDLMETKLYQLGEEFSPGIDIVIARRWRKLITRTEYVLNKCAGKRVLHVGCADHLRLIESKRATGMWLHENIMQIAEKCIGIDISTEGIDAMRRLGYEAYTVDIGKQKPEFLDTEYDVVVVAETLEHIDDPTEFLRAVRNNLGDYVKEVVITTPNGFRQDNFRYAIRNIESINTDHKTWFTPYTLCKTISRAGLEVMELAYTYGPVPPRSVVVRGLYRSCPVLAMGLGAVARIA